MNIQGPQDPMALRTQRSHEENQERAFIAASRRTDRSLEARIESAKKASLIHKSRTGKSLRITDQAVINEEMYEEEDNENEERRKRVNRQLASHCDELSAQLGPNLISRAPEHLNDMASAYHPFQMMNHHLALLNHPGHPSHPLTAHPSTAHHLPTHPSTAHPLPAHPFTAYPTTAHHLPAHPSTAYPTTAHSLPAYPYAARPSTARPSPTRPSPTLSSPARPSPTRHSPTRRSPARPSSARASTGHHLPANPFTSIQNGGPQWSPLDSPFAWPGQSVLPDRKNSVPSLDSPLAWPEQSVLPDRKNSVPSLDSPLAWSGRSVPDKDRVPSLDYSSGSTPRRVPSFDEGIANFEPPTPGIGYGAPSVLLSDFDDKYPGQRENSISSVEDAVAHLNRVAVAAKDDVDTSVNANTTSENFEDISGVNVSPECWKFCFDRGFWDSVDSDCFGMEDEF